MNNVTLVGNLGNNPELRNSNNGKEFITFSLATNDGFGDNKKTNWHNCIAFGKPAELIHHYTQKGSKLAISGSIEYKKVEEKHYTSIIVNSFTLLDKKDDNSFIN